MFTFVFTVAAVVGSIIAAKKLHSIKTEVLYGENGDKNSKTISDGITAGCQQAKKQHIKYIAGVAVVCSIITGMPAFLLTIAVYQFTMVGADYLCTGLVVKRIQKRLAAIKNS